MTDDPWDGKSGSDSVSVSVSAENFLDAAEAQGIRFGPQPIADGLTAAQRQLIADLRELEIREHPPEVIHRRVNGLTVVNDRLLQRRGY